MRRRLGMAAALGAGVPVAAAWIALTAATGKTYHLAPAVVAAAPPYLWRAARRGPVRPALLAGLATALAGWAVLALAGISPSATLVDGQPGGVALETLVSLALGAAVGAGRGPVWLATRFRARAR